MPNDNKPPRRTSNVPRVNSRTGWAGAGAIVVLIFGLLLFSTERDAHQKSGEHPANTATQSQPQK
jgi:hypothetical protein